MSQALIAYDRSIRNPQGNTPLLQAVKDGNLAAVKATFATGKNPLFTAMDSNGDSALAIASRPCKPEIAKAIMDEFRANKTYSMGGARSLRKKSRKMKRKTARKN